MKHRKQYTLLLKDQGVLIMQKEATPRGENKAGMKRKVVKKDPEDKKA